MNKDAYELLHFVPAHAEYAVDATDLDPEDIPVSRVRSILELLSCDDPNISFSASRLLTSWGFREGLASLSAVLGAVQDFEGLEVHRLHGYDDTFKLALSALVGYFTRLSDRGTGEAARAEIVDPIKKIIQLSNSRPFEISGFFWLVEGKKFFEYVPALREHLCLIAQAPNVHRWKIYDVLNLLLKVDHEFASDFLRKAHKTLDDFKVSGK
ncbi:hypothetical protein DYL59_15920 [Pseudomonas kairouanensis]|uniref:HEAT repeat domain-containing protein n=1 Tax=Pseudomonas kairouanensis TaxID=2293832 RepID=A0A4Z0AQR5_9PSED|nr:hypothetical protein [Pseudomonas kairouanensis]TFY88298.1 hypothetical protein DYL59_15920 [Pseudomonas kairouanensis]